MARRGLFSQKNYMVDVWLGSKHTSVVHEKWCLSLKISKCHFFVKIVNDFLPLIIFGNTPHHTLRKIP